MRYYAITISPSSQSSTSFSPITFSTLTQSKTNNGSALLMEIDVFQTWYHQPAQNGYIKLRGVPFTYLNNASNLNFAKIQVEVGMSSGLPYANPKQAGIILDGTILQCFGNFQGTEISLDLVIGPATYDPNINVNIPFTWKQKTTLESAVRQSIGTAYKGVPINGKFSDNLIYTEDTWGFNYQNLLAFGQAVNELSKQVLPDPAYTGACIANTSTGFLLYDNTYTPTKNTDLASTDIIGNLTWINVNTIQVKVVMRHDIEVGQTITVPKGFPVLNLVNNYSQYRWTYSFSGKFTVNSVRHVGNSRQADGNSWVTVIDAYITP
jgi:hypothetical protein